MIKTITTKTKTITISGLPEPIFSLRKPARCARFPCRAARADGDPCYCAEHREEVYATAWLLIEIEEPAT